MGGESSLIPARKLHAPTTAVIGIMTFVMLVVAAAGLALSSAAGTVARAAEARFMIEIPAPLSAELPKALAAARLDPAVVDAHAIPASELRSTLEQWLGDAASSPDLPVPTLIAVQLRPGSEGAELRTSLARHVPGAIVIAESAELGPMIGTLRALQWLALSLVVLVAAATAAAVILAARGALDTHRATIEVMHGIGATDRQVTKLFERKIAVDAIAGALAGSFAATVGLVLVGSVGADLAGSFQSAPPLTPGDIALLFVLAFLVVVLATLVARWTVMKALRETL
jgi:cell division transport system permease protein